jgi:hypothetical protein
VTVVLKGMFTLDEGDAGGTAFATELETDVAAECTKLGVVEKVGVMWLPDVGVLHLYKPATASFSKRI